MTTAGPGRRHQTTGGGRRVTKARPNVEENLDDENVNLEEEGRRSRTGVRLGVEAKW